MPLLSTVFTSLARIERKVSREAVIRWSDHDRDGYADTDVVNDAINQATSEIKLYAGKWYADSSLAAAPIINSWATTLACYFLASTRANPIPDSLQKEFERIMELLKQVAAGGLVLPGVAMNGDLRPTMSNRKIDRRYRRNTVRVIRSNSTDAPSVLGQDWASDYPID